MVDLVYCLTNLLFFDIALLYYYINLRSLIICSLFSRNIYFSLGIALSNPVFFVSSSIVLEPSCGELPETYVIFWSILLSIKSAVAFAVLNYSFQSNVK